MKYINKKNIKKITNTALAALLFLGCFPQSGEAENNITLSDNNMCTVKGYATEVTTTYDVDIYWADQIVFVFDRGIHNSSTGSLDCTFPAADTENTGIITSSMVEKDAQAGDVNKWYGFNGISNRIIVLNRSNAPIKSSYAATTNQENEEVKDKVTLQLYGHDKNKNNETDNLRFTIQQNSNNANYGIPVDFFDTDDKIHRFGNNQEITSEIIPGAPLDGTMYGNKIFLNITGTPGDNFPTEYSDSDPKCKIGTITITIDKNIT